MWELNVDGAESDGVESGAWGVENGVMECATFPYLPAVAAAGYKQKMKTSKEVCSLP